MTPGLPLENSFLFERFTLSISNRRLTRDGSHVDIEPRTIALLAFLIENRHRVVSTEELLRKIWAGRVVSAASVSVCISDARRALDDTASRQRFIRTVYGVGYQFVANARPLHDRPGRKSHSRSGFAGRKAELAVAERWLSEPDEGAAILLISGEAGIGKTRLLREICDMASPARVLVARCEGFTVNPPLSVWSQILGRDFGKTIEQYAQREFKFAPATSRFQFFNLTMDSLAEKVLDNDVLIAIDDLHRADELSLQFLRFALYASRSDRIRFVATYRDTEVDGCPGLSEVLSTAYRMRPEMEIALQGLTLQEVGELLGGPTAWPAGRNTLSAIWEKSKGNPLFALLMASATRRFELGACLPPGIAGAATAHLGALNEAVRDVAKVASVIGNRFEPSLLSRCLEQEEELTREHLEFLTRHRVIARSTSAPGSFEFVHSLVRDALYQQLDSKQRRAHHKSIAEIAISDDSHSVPPQEIAFHLTQAGDPRGFSYHLRSAREAERRFSYDCAAVSYRYAIETRQLDSTDGFIEEQQDLLLSLGRCELLAGRSKEAFDVFSQAARHARHSGRPEELAEVAVRSAPDFFSIECGVFDQDLIELLEEALQILPGESDIRVRVAARLVLARLWAPGSEERISQLSKYVRDQLRSSDDIVVQAEVLPALWRANWDENCLAERVRVAKLLPTLGGEISPETNLVCRMLAVAARLELGDRAMLDNEIMEFSTLAERTRHPRAIWYAEMFRSVRLLMNGEFSEAEYRYKEFSRLAETVSDSNGVHSAALHEYLLLWEAGRPDEFVKKSERAVSRYPNVPGWRAILAFMYTESGEIDHAEREYEALKRAGIEGMSMRIDWVSAFTLGLAQTCHALGDSHFAWRIYERLRPFSGREAIAGAGALACGSVDRYLGLLAETGGELERALSHFRYAIEFDTNFGARPWVVHAQLNAAAVLVKLDRVDQSIEMSRLAVVGAKEMGMQNAAFKGERLLRQTARRRLAG